MNRVSRIRSTRSGARIPSKRSRTGWKQEANAYFDKIRKIGGVLPAIETGFFQREIAESAARYQTEIEKKDRVIVGVNDYVVRRRARRVPLLRVDEAGARHQMTG